MSSGLLYLVYFAWKRGDSYSVLLADEWIGAVDSDLTGWSLGYDAYWTY